MYGVIIEDELHIYFIILYISYRSSPACPTHLVHTQHNTSSEASNQISAVLDHILSYKWRSSGIRVVYEWCTSGVRLAIGELCVAEQSKCVTVLHKLEAPSNCREGISRTMGELLLSTPNHIV